MSKLSPSTLLRSGWAHDFTIACQDKTYQVHRPILAANAGFFRSMFSCTPQASTIDFTDHHVVTPKVLDRLIEVWYGSSDSSTVIGSREEVFHHHEVMEEIRQACLYLSCDPVTLEYQRILPSEAYLAVQPSWFRDRLLVEFDDKTFEASFELENTKDIVEEIQRWVARKTNGECIDLPIELDWGIQVTYESGDTELFPKRHYLIHDPYTHDEDNPEVEQEKYIRINDSIIVLPSHDSVSLQDYVEEALRKHLGISQT